MPIKHWSITQNLAETVKNPNIVIKGKHSYYSDAWTGSFEDYCVRYLYGDIWTSCRNCIVPREIRLSATVYGPACEQ